MKHRRGTISPGAASQSIDEIAAFEKHVGRLDAVAKTKPARATQVISGPLSSDNPQGVRQRVRALLKNQSRRVLDIFKQWDTDGSNSLGRDEFERAMQSLGIVKQSEIHSLWVEFDADGSG